MLSGGILYILITIKMFKIILKKVRPTVETPWMIPIPVEFKQAFYQKYESTKKFLYEKAALSDDQLTLEKESVWASAKDYMDFLLDDDERISVCLEEIALYRNSGKFVEDVIYEDESMGNFYHHPHIFLVFRPGEAGNFISSLIDNLIAGSTNALPLSDSGHAHFNRIVERKKLGTDYLALGMGLDGIDPDFFSVEDKLTYYRKKIDTANYENDRYVTWTHDFGNIPLYKSMFPNCKILTVTSDSFGERIVGLLMSLIKNYFSDDNQMPIVPNLRFKIEILKKVFIHEYFKKYYSGKKYQEGHKELDLFLILQGHLEAHKLDLNTSLNSTIPYKDVNDDESLSLIKRRIQYSVGMENATMCDSTIKFKSILDCNVEELIRVIEHLLGRTLTPVEVSYVDKSLKMYASKQDRSLIDSPVEYINSLKLKADMIVSSFENI